MSRFFSSLWNETLRILECLQIINKYVCNMIYTNKLYTASYGKNTN